MKYRGVRTSLPPLTRNFVMYTQMRLRLILEQLSLHLRNLCKYSCTKKHKHIIALTCAHLRHVVDKVRCVFFRDQQTQEAFPENDEVNLLRSFNASNVVSSHVTLLVVPHAG